MHVGEALHALDRACWVPFQSQCPAPGRNPLGPKIEPAVVPVARLAEPRHDMLPVGAQAPENRSGGDWAGQSEEADEDVRKAAVLDEEARAILGTVQKVDRCGNRRPLSRCYSPLAIEGRRQEVAVRTPTMAERSRKARQRSKFLAAAQQDLGRTDRASRNDHGFGVDNGGLTAPVFPQTINHPPRGTFARDTAYQPQWTGAGAPPFPPRP